MIEQRRGGIGTQQSLILFDCDGTLMSSHKAISHAMQQAFQNCALPEPVEADVFEVIGLSLREAILMLGGRSDNYERIAFEYRNLYRAAEHGLKLNPGVVETLQLLQQNGYWLGIVTGKSRAGLLRVLKAFDLERFFYVSRTADCCASKPHPAMVLESMEEMGVQAAHTTVVGDAVFDMQMACAAGVSAIGVSFGVASRDDLASAGATLIVDNFSDLLNQFQPLQDAKVLSTMSEV